MAKLGKILALTALLGAAGAGAYYYYKSKEEELDDDFDDFDDFEDEFEDEDDSSDFSDEDILEDDVFEEEPLAKSAPEVKEFIPISITKEEAEEAKNAIKNAAKEIEKKGPEIKKYEFEELKLSDEE